MAAETSAAVPSLQRRVAAQRAQYGLHAVGISVEARGGDPSSPGQEHRSQEPSGQGRNSDLPRAGGSQAAQDARGRDRNTQAQLVAKGLNVVFRTHGKPTIAAEQ